MKKVLRMVAAVCGVMAVASVAGADDVSLCPGTLATVSGSVTTINLSAENQLGVVELTLTDEQGETLFSRHGGIIGEVVEPAAPNGESIDGVPVFQSLLNHAMFFGHFTRLKTSGDVALAVPTGKMLGDIPCEFLVSETITSAEGSRRLRKLSNDYHAIVATGTLSFCLDNNSNEFQLSGVACLSP